MNVHSNKMNNNTVRSDRDAIVVTNIAYYNEL